MSPLKLSASGFVALALSVALPAFAADAPQQAADASAACKQARQDLFFMQQLATSDGGTNPYHSALTPVECGVTGQTTKSATAKKTKPAEKADAVSSSAAYRYN